MRQQDVGEVWKKLKTGFRENKMYYGFNHKTKEITKHKNYDEARPKNTSNQLFFDCVENYAISTVFLNIDHNFGEGEPLLFETMIFKAKDGKIDDFLELYCKRYHSYESAEKGHKFALENYKDLIDEN
jgi:hypothetical protein